MQKVDLDPERDMTTKSGGEKYKRGSKAETNIRNPSYFSGKEVSNERRS